MKKIFFLLFLVTVTCFSQESFNFSTTNGVLTWEKIYESDLSKEDIKKILKQDPVLHPITEGFTGQSIPKKIKCAATTPIYMRDQVQFFASIEFKEGRYRVQVSGIKLVPEETVELAGVRTTETAVALEDFQLKNNGDLRSGKMHQNSLQCLDSFLSEKFEFKVTKNDW